jgi:hypothetical protein
MSFQDYEEWYLQGKLGGVRVQASAQLPIIQNHRYWNGSLESEGQDH